MEVIIDINVTGDCWNNRNLVEQQLKNLSADDTIILDLHTEGPSLNRLGVVDLVTEYTNPAQVSVTKWANSFEKIPFKTFMCNRISHFWKYSKNYWIDPIPNKLEFHFGLFLGRKTIARNRIIYDCAIQWPDKFLLSQMGNVVSNSLNMRPGDLELIDQWINHDVADWTLKNSILSIDNKSVRDQYRVLEKSSAECNLSLLKHYHRFGIELVCETYTLGDTFFPTEKTVRPIMATKPFLLYGPKHFLENLRQLGFKTYSDCWSEQYDLLEGFERWQAIQQIINNLSKESLKDILKQANQIAVHNRINLQKLIGDL